MEHWNSRRSSVCSTKGICSSSQPLASAAGIKILEQGGTAADACVAMAAALNVTEPCSTGIGGDAFALYYDAASGKVSCLQGNGMAPAALDLDMLKAQGIGHGSGLKDLPLYSALCITVPGSAALWEDLVKLHGKLQLSAVLQPAINLAEDGFALGPVTAHQWSKAYFQGEEAERVLRPNNGRTPGVGELTTNVDLARTFRELGEKGATAGFYTGRIAESIVEASSAFGGVISLDDLNTHRTVFEEPISTTYKGYRVYETPPPTHGQAALMALNLIEALDNAAGTGGSIANNDIRRGSANEAHREIECMRLAFADCLDSICDPLYNYAADGPHCKAIRVMDAMLSKEYGAQRARMVQADSSCVINSCGDVTPFLTSETVQFCCIDQYGNGCSMINSNYHQFGTGIMPRGCGFTLQNRGHNFSLDPAHPNVLAPKKRPYHTIIPALMTRESDNSLYSCLGVMGGFMQPQGHFQVIRNLLDFNMDPQAAIDAPRWRLTGAGKTRCSGDMQLSIVEIEDGYGGYADGSQDTGNDRGEAVLAALTAMGHDVKIARGHERTAFGRGQIIIRDNVTGVVMGGSDPRADGCAIPQL